VRVLHITAGLGNGGAEGALYRLVIADQHADTHVVVSFMDEGKYGPMLKARGIQVVTLEWPRGRVSVSGLMRLWHLLRTGNWDVVQTWMYHADLIGGVLARLAGIRRVFWGIRNSTLQRGKSKYSTIVINRINALLSHVVPAAVICCAEAAREVHVRQGYDSTRMVVVPNGFYPCQQASSHVDARRLREDWGVRDCDFVVGMIARYDPQKNHEGLLDSLAEVRRQGVSVRAVLAGLQIDEDNSELCSGIAKRDLTDRVLLLGQQSNVPLIMQALDLHVLSSTYGEAFPNVIAEAMICGTPCATTDVGDASIIVGDTGWVVGIGDSRGLAAAIVEASKQAGDTTAWTARRQAARTRIEQHFSIQSMVRGFRDNWSNDWHRGSSQSFGAVQSGPHFGASRGVRSLRDADVSGDS